MTVNFGISDDYAVLKSGNYIFYYGYEETIKVNDQEEWAFVVWNSHNRGENEIVRWSLDEVKLNLENYYAKKLDNETPEYILLVCIGLFLDRQHNRKLGLFNWQETDKD